VKLFFLPEGKSDIESRRMYAHEALSSVAKQLGIDKFDTLILSLPGIVLEKDEEDYHSKEFPISNKTLDEWIKTWNVILSHMKISYSRFLKRSMLQDKLPGSEYPNSG